MTFKKEKQKLPRNWRSKSCQSTGNDIHCRAVRIAPDLLPKDPTQKENKIWSTSRCDSFDNYYLLFWSSSNLDCCGEARTIFFLTLWLSTHSLFPKNFKDLWPGEISIRLAARMSGGSETNLLFWNWCIYLITINQRLQQTFPKEKADRG